MEELCGGGEADAASYHWWVGDAVDEAASDANISVAVILKGLRHDDDLKSPGGMTLSRFVKDCDVEVQPANT